MPNTSRSGRKETLRKYRQSKKGKENQRRYRRSQAGKERDRICNLMAKIDVLAHYGKAGRPACRWRGCPIDDLDMLSIDHIENDGAEHRRRETGSGIRIYFHLRSRGYPKGYQTLCHNHQWKKEILRRERATL
jgi:hypothetical protein